MIEYRCFRNDDPPRLADVWRSAELGPGGFQPMTSAWLEACVFSKPYFDREGLLVASDGDRVVGFAHAAFGPNAARSAIDRVSGTTMLVVVVPHDRHEEIAAGLLERCESYLRRRGATTIMGGGTPQLGGFYLGLYGGSDLPGVLDSSPAMQAVFRRAGYAEAERIAVMRRPLAGFRPPVSRQMRNESTVPNSTSPAAQRSRRPGIVSKRCTILVAEK
jgi:GNAT superfamily N-acetyltransferase